MHVSGVIDDDVDLVEPLTIERVECPVFCMGGNMFSVAPETGETEQAFAQRIWKSATELFRCEVRERFIENYKRVTERVRNDMSLRKTFPIID